VSEYDYLRGLARSMEAPFVFDVTVVCGPTGDRSPLVEQLSEQEIASFFRELAKEAAPRAGGNLVPGEPFCSAGRSTARITPSGDVTPCVAIPTVVGSLRESSLTELWRSPALDELRSLTLEDLPACRDCPLREVCLRCPGQALVEAGGLTAPCAAACRVARAYVSVAGAVARRPGTEGAE
jgi:radical SAM protein with 4Fe4S-binding SPASM domain